MSRRCKIQLLVLAALCMCSCEALQRGDIAGFIYSTSPGPDSRFEDSCLSGFNGAHELDQDHFAAPVSVPSAQYKVYIISDTHISGPTAGLPRFISALEADPDAAPFALHIGDIIDKQPEDYETTVIGGFGTAWNKMFFTPGNHDIYFSQWKLYRDNIGSASYMIPVVFPGGKDLFICVDSSSGGLGVKQTKWLESVLEGAKDEYRNIFIFTHTHFFTQSDTSSFNFEETMELAKLFSDKGVREVISGHVHQKRSSDFGGVHYQVVPSCGRGGEENGYCVMTVAEKVDYQFILAD